jgi:hypothetical protein
MATTKKAATKKTNSNKGTRVSGSLADQIDRLPLGSSVAQAERIRLDKIDDISDLITDSLKKLRSGMAAYVARVVDGDLDTREYKTESGTYVTDDKTAVVVTVTVTRMQ